MGTRLLEISYKGDIPSLCTLIRDNPHVLDLSSFSDDNNPLHMAVIAGQVEYASEILRMKPELALERNQDGFTPLHIASSKGDVTMVKDILLKLGNKACLEKGREERIPLHCAAIKGRVQVMEVLLSAWPDSVEVVTARGETAVHLAVKNSQFEGFQVLAEHLKQSKKESVLNCKDSQGNTVLHIAAAREEYQVIQAMVSGFADEALIEVNNKNDAGLTALDMLFLPTKEARDMEIVEILTKYGAARVTGSEMAPPQAQLDIPGTMQLGLQGQTSMRLRWMESFEFKKERDTPADVRNALLVVAALIVTATYQAVLQVPGGLWQDDSGPHQAGQTVLGTKKPVSYVAFLVSNSFGFFASILMIQMLIEGLPMRALLKGALFALVFTYDTLMVTYSPNTVINNLFVGLSIIMPILVSILYECRRRK